MKIQSKQFERVTPHTGLITIASILFEVHGPLYAPPERQGDDDEISNPFPFCFFFFLCRVTCE